MKALHISRLSLIVCLAVCAWVGSTSSAGASFGIRSFEVHYTEAPLAGAQAGALGPPDFQAGSHPYEFTAKFAFNTSADAKGKQVPDGAPKSVQIKLPRGVAGDLQRIPQCKQSSFRAGTTFGPANCPLGSQVGMLILNGEEKHALYNLAPPAGVAGQIGAVVIAPVVIDLSIRSGSDYGLTAELRNLSSAKEVKEISISLWGVPADSGHDHLRCVEKEGSTENESCPSGAPAEPLLTMPTSCGEPLTTTIVVNSWEDPEEDIERSTTAVGANGEPSNLSGCERLHFDPSVTVQPESAIADAPTGLSIDAHVPFRGGSSELAGPDLENVVFALPGGLSINAATGGGLNGCTAAEIALGQVSKPTCPDSSKIGTLEIQTPILAKPLTGFVYLAEPAGGLFEGALTIYLAGETAGLNFKLVGQLSAQPESGQLTLTLDGVPELPFSDLRLDLFGGPRGAIANPTACGPFTTVAALTPYSSSETTTRSSEFTIAEGCSGGFAPSFNAGAASSAAGQSTGFALQVNRTDGQQYIRELTAVLPAGLMGNISSVPQCSDADAAAGTCPASSEIGTISVGAGAGTDPFYLNGHVYLTGPYAGAPFGVSIVIPALAGPFNLGTVLVRGKITVDLAASRMTIATDPFPTILQGVPLRAKSLHIEIDRPNFMVNPTTCAGQTTSGTVSSTAGAAAAVSAPFRALGCSGLSFAPKLAATTPGKASNRGDGAGFDMKVTAPAGVHANLKSVVIKLPKALKARLSAVQQACLAATFAANPQACPAASLVGKAAVDTPMLGTPLTGPVYLVFYRHSKYPDLVMVLQGSGLSLQLKGTVEVNNGINITTFDSLPDIPMSLFELDLPEGRHSLLGATENLCAKHRSMFETVVGQNGARNESSVGVAVEGCQARAAKASAHRRGKTAEARKAARGSRGRRR